MTLVSRRGLRAKAERFYSGYPLSDDKSGHSKAVANCAERIAKRMARSGIKIDVPAVYAGGLLHDIGIASSPHKTEADEEEDPWPEHALFGARDALAAGFPESVVACIQYHENLGFTGKEMAELNMPPPAIGDSYSSTLIEAKVVWMADNLICMVRNMGLDPWKDKDSIVRANFGYFNKVFLKRMGRRVPEGHPVMRRLLSTQQEIIPYARPADVPPAWKGLAGTRPHT